MAVEEGKLPPKVVPAYAPFKFNVEGANFAQLFFDVKEHIATFVQGASMVTGVKYDITDIFVVTDSPDNEVVKWGATVKGTISFLDKA